MTARRRGMTEEATDATIDQACRMLRMPTIRNSFTDQADRAASEQMSYRRRQVAPASPQQAGPVEAVPAAALGAQGCRHAAQLYRKVGARGFAGSYALVRSYLDAYRVRPDPAAPPPPTATSEPSARWVA